MQHWKSNAATFLAAIFALVSVTSSSSAVVVNAGGVTTETVVNHACPSDVECYIKFSVVPTAVTVQRVSCNFYFPVGNQGVQVTGSEAGFYTGLKYYLATFLNTVGAFPSAYSMSSTQFQFLSDVMYGVPANSRPAIHIGYNQGTPATFSCAVSYIPQAPN